jgi:hypothetical protein
VPAYSRPSGPIVTLVNMRPVAGVAALSNATPAIPVPELAVPTVKTLDHGWKAFPETSRTPLVTSNR